MKTEKSQYLAAIAEAEEKVLAGGALAFEEAEHLLNAPDEYLMHLAGAADRIRICYKGYSFDACSLINAKSGLCSEDCAFCAQSARHRTDCDVYPLKSEEDILKAAENAFQTGARRFCTVTSGPALSDGEFEKLLGALARVRCEVDIALDASLGFLDDRRAHELHAVGVSRYNHNLETCRDHFPNICTTHSFDDRVATVQTVKSHGMSICCGGIIGLGETPRQRALLAFTLRDLGVDCVPINILNARPGTRLAESIPPEPMEIVRTVAIFRFILPQATIKIAGGREANLRDFQGMALRSGANGMIIGGYLTTAGRSVVDDVRMIREAGFQC
ncbi:MAG: biotin synthase BioB [Desulfomonilaceae bacterium]